MGRGVTHHPAGVVVAAEEAAAALLVVGQGAEGFAHAEGAHHLLGDVGGALQVVGGAGCDLTKHHLFSAAAAQQGGDLTFEVFLGIEEALFGGQLQGVAQGAHAAGHDRDLGHLAAAGHQVPHDRVADFVIRHHFFLIGLQHPALLLQTSHHALNRLVEVALLHLGAIGAGCEQGSFVHEVGQVGAGKAAGGLGNFVEVDGAGELHLLGVDLQNQLATRQVGAIHQHLAVETAWPQQRSIKGFGLVGGCQHNHRLVLAGKAIHLRE